MSFETVSIGSVCKVIAGQSPEGKYYNKDGVGLPFYQGKKDFGEVFIDPPSVWTTKTTKEAIKNDILMSVRAPVGPVNIATESICIGRGLAAIRATEKVNNYYLFNYLLSIEKDLVGKSGAVFNSINKGQIESLKIPLPSLPIQQMIVARLDVIFAQIDRASAAAEANSKNIEALFQNYLTKVFECEDNGWDRKKISDIAKIKGGKRVPKGCELGDKITPYPYLRVTDFGENGCIDTSKLKYVEQDVRDVIKNYIINSEDLYISIAGTIGRTGIVPKELSGSLLTENACRLVFNKDISNRFVYYFTKSSIFKFQSIEQTRTAAQPKLALSRLGEITLSVPSIEIQNQVVNELDELASYINLSKNSYLAKSLALKDLKQSILKKAFNGELVKG